MAFPVNILNPVIQTCAFNPALSLILVTATCVVIGWYIRDSLKIGNIYKKHVLVTGCDSGFGNLLARQLDRTGFQVIAACMTEKGMSDIKASTSPRLQTLLLDVTDSDSVDRAVRMVRGKVGEQGLWGLVNNAGRSTPVGPPDWMQVEDFEKVLNVNLMGVIAVTVKFLPLVKKARGRVVNVASVMGRLSLTGGGYCLSKYGVEAFSDSLRRSMHFFGVKVSIIEPGFFRTAVTRLDLIEADLRRLWGQLPTKTKESYGDMYLDEYMKAQSFFMNILCSSDLSKVTACMQHALTARHPRSRYGAGWDAKLIWIPVSYLPSFIPDFVMRCMLPTPKGSCL